MPTRLCLAWQTSFVSLSLCSSSLFLQADDENPADDEALVLYPDSEKSPPFNHQQLHHMTSPNYKLLPWAQRCLTQLQDPIKKCEELYEILLALQDILDQNLNRKQQPYLDESPKVMKQRWDKIIEELYDKEKEQFDWYCMLCPCCLLAVEHPQNALLG